MAAKKKPAGKAETWTCNRGKQPVANTAYVEVRLRNGTLTQNEAGMFAWSIDGARVPAGEADIMAWRRMRKPRQPKAEPVPADHVDGQPPTSGAWPQEWIGGEIHDTDAESTVLLCRDGKATFYRWDGKCWSSTEVPATVQIMCNGTLVPQSAFFASKGIPSQPQHMTIPPAPWPHPDPAFILVEEPRLIVLPPVPAEELMRRSDLVRQQAADEPARTSHRSYRWALVAVCIVVLVAIGLRVIP